MTFFSPGETWSNFSLVCSSICFVVTQTSGNGCIKNLSGFERCLVLVKHMLEI